MKPYVLFVVILSLYVQTLKNVKTFAASFSKIADSEMDKWRIEIFGFAKLA